MVTMTGTAPAAFGGSSMKPTTAKTWRGRGSGMAVERASETVEERAGLFEAVVVGGMLI